MDIRTRNIIMIVICVILTVGAIVGVVIGVTTHTEPGLMSVCWQLDGSANYNASSCTSPHELRWDRSHIPLVVDAPTNSSEVTSAISLVNSQVGCEVLHLSPGAGSGADVSVLLNGPVDVGLEDAGGSTQHLRGATGRMTAIVKTMNVTNPTMIERVLVHEFGHVLGLSHDPFQSSIMYPTQPDTTEIDFIRFTDSDVRLLNSLYCR